ncbi:MAG: DUF1080 domain-containing protein [Chitinophagaceae bacterium]|nr:DUF1080 domain-containing protein [Chitinophagaceae bacterium]
MKYTIIATGSLLMLLFSNVAYTQQQWISLFNGKDLTGWTARGNAQWLVKDGAIIGQNGQGHLYAAPVVKDFEVKGDSIFIWVKEQLVMTYRDNEYKEGRFVIQCHNPGMTAEARNLYYRKLDE